jgi:hypothetical protein
VTNKRVLLLFAFSILFAALFPIRAADTLPAQYSDAEFWKLINDFSEPGGTYQYENFVSNEISYQTVIPELKQRVKPNGVYLGVGPEQNFTYIAAVQPKIAFVLDIRRQNMIELLMYKALFELSADRADFVSKLFSRRRPAGLNSASSAEAIFGAFDPVPVDLELYKSTLQSIKDTLLTRHQFKPIGDDELKIESIFNVFMRGGPRMTYAFASSSPNNQVPSYVAMMVASDNRSQNWAYLNSEDRYQFVRQMQQKNLIVPLVGDFGGPKTLKAVGTYLKERGAVVSVFYLSNVEDYIESKWPAFVSNVRALPQDDTSMVIRFITSKTTLLGWMRDLPDRWPAMFTNLQ